VDIVSTRAAAGREDASAHPAGWLRPRRLLVLFDAVSVAAALVALRLFLEWKDVQGWRVAEATFAGVAIFIVVSLLMVFRNGQYSVGSRMSRMADVGNLIKSLLMGLAVASVLFYATKGFFSGKVFPSRLVVTGTVGLFTVLTIGSRLALATYQRSLFAKGKGVRNVHILGTGKASEDLLALIEQRPWMGIRCAGRLVYGSSSRGADHPRTDAICITDTMEGLENLDRALRIADASTVLVALDPHEHAVIPQVHRLLTLSHVPYKIMPSLFEQSYAASSSLSYADLPSVLQLRVDPLDRAQLACKRMLDVTLGSILMVVILPFTALLATLIKLDSRGPVFYKQERVGLNGRRFQMFKFRTMVSNAETLLDGLATENEAEADNGQMFKMKDDPRITRVGRFLRKWSLDELPQIFNVFRWEMSLVGPRPPLPREVDNYEPEHLCRLKGIPGITGLWQVSGRSELSFEEMVRLDKYYLENWSLALDLSIMVKTVSVVLTGKGAY
jgi:exopolysaccharide biosynthesis polyprenyl glycosylphosphotransferase